MPMHFKARYGQSPHSQGRFLYHHNGCTDSIVSQPRRVPSHHNVSTFRFLDTPHISQRWARHFFLTPSSHLSSHIRRSLTFVKCTPKVYQKIRLVERILGVDFLTLNLPPLPYPFLTNDTRQSGNKKLPRLRVQRRTSMAPGKPLHTSPLNKKRDVSPSALNTTRA